MRAQIKHTGLTNDTTANGAPEVELILSVLFPVVKWRSRSVAKPAYSKNGKDAVFPIRKRWQYI